MQDLNFAESLFVENDDARSEQLLERYGVYWRCSKVLDFCYLVNPYFPPQRLKDKLKANSDTNLTEYSSGMRDNRLLDKKYFGVHSENIVIGTRVAELII